MPIKRTFRDNKIFSGKGLLIKKYCPEGRIDGQKYSRKKRVVKKQDLARKNSREKGIPAKKISRKKGC